MNDNNTETFNWWKTVLPAAAGSFHQRQCLSLCEAALIGCHAALPAAYGFNMHSNNLTILAAWMDLIVDHFSGLCLWCPGRRGQDDESFHQKSSLFVLSKTHHLKVWHGGMPAFLCWECAEVFTGQLIHTHHHPLHRNTKAREKLDCEVPKSGLWR